MMTPAQAREINKAAYALYDLCREYDAPIGLIAAARNTAFTSDDAFEGLASVQAAKEQS